MPAPTSAPQPAVTPLPRPPVGKPDADLVARPASDCDIEALVELTSAGGFTYSFGDDRLPSQHWLARIGIDENGEWTFFVGGD